MHAADIRNRFMCPRIATKTSSELMAGVKPRVDHIRAFSSLTSAHVPKQKRKKLDTKSKQGGLIDWIENNLYKVRIRDSLKPILSRHVYILENNFPSDEWYSAVSDDLFLGEKWIEWSVARYLDILQGESNSNTPLPPPSVPVRNNNDNAEEHGETNSVDAPTYIQSVSPAHEGPQAHLDQTITSQENQEAQESGSAGDRRRYPQRERQPVQLLDPSSADIAVGKGDPTSLEAPSVQNESEGWRAAIENELQSLKEH